METIDLKTQNSPDLWTIFRSLDASIVYLVSRHGEINISGFYLAHKIMTNFRAQRNRFLILTLLSAFHPITAMIDRDISECTEAETGTQSAFVLKVLPPRHPSLSQPFIILVMYLTHNGSLCSTSYSF